MPISVLCKCGKRYEVPDAHAGRTLRCKACGNAVQVPAATRDENLEEDPFANAEFGSYDVAGDDEASAPSRPRGTTIVDAAGGRGGTILAMPTAGRSGTSASNPGRMKIDPATVIKLNRLEWLFPLGLAVAGLIVALVIGKWWVALIGLGVGVFMLVTELNELAGKFRDGDVNPGIIVSEKPCLVAVTTDLTKGGGSYPLLKIFKAPFHTLAGGPPQTGQRVTTASYYAPSTLDPSHWADFMPVVTESVTSNSADIARLMRSIPASQWQLLETVVARVQPPLPGNYKLWEPGWETQGVRFRNRNRRGLVMLAIIVPAIALVIYQNKRQTQAELEKPTHVPTSSTPRPAPRITPPRPAPVRPTPPTVQPPARTTTQPSVVERPLRREPPRVVTPATAPSPEAHVTRAPRAAPEPAPASRPAPPPGPAKQFAVGDAVEVEWGNRWWPSTVVKREGRRYLIHYDGWSDSHDEWVGPDRIRAR